MNMKINNQALQVAGSTYQSRLIVGSGKYKDFQENLAALEASGRDDHCCFKASQSGPEPG